MGSGGVASLTTGYKLASLRDALGGSGGRQDLPRLTVRGRASTSRVGCNVKGRHLRP